MGQRQIRLLLSVWIIGCVATEEERKFSVTIDTVQVNEGDRAEPSASSGHQIQVKEENHEEETTKVEPNDLRTVPRTLHTDSPDDCCGIKSSNPSIRSTEPIVRNGDHDSRINSDRAYNPRFGPPEDRYGWQNVNKVQALPDRYNQRPASSDNNYAGTTRPGTSYGTANYGDNRPHGSAIYSTKPAYGVGPYGGEAAEFGPDTHGYQDVAPAFPTGINIYTQKAVALKALAGVALIGAAAALATNPALMPLGMISGRRKRSLSEPKGDEPNRPLKFLDHFISQLKSPNGGLDFSVTPTCVARLTCEVQRDYIADLKQTEKNFTGDKKVLQEMENWFIDLIRRNVLDVDYVSNELKKLIKLAVSVGSENRDCRIFSCDMVKNE